MLIALLILLLVPQTLSVTLPANTPFTLSFEHDGLLMPDFRAWCDGSIVKNFSAMDGKPSIVANANGLYTYTVQVPGLPVGTHSCWVTAFNQNGESKVCAAGQTSTDAAPCVVPLTFPVGAPAPVGKPPAVPVNIRLVVGVGG